MGELVDEPVVEGNTCDVISNKNSKWTNTIPSKSVLEDTIGFQCTQFCKILPMIRLQPSHTFCSNYASKDFNMSFYKKAVEDKIENGITDGSRLSVA